VSLISRSIAAALITALLLSAACSTTNSGHAGAGQIYVPDVGVIGPELDYIAFGSCLNQDKPQPILDTIVSDRPDLFVFLGDNIYADTDDPAEIAATYRKLASRSGFKQLRSNIPVIATWDDHDYGQNDIGKDYISKNASRELMLDFWGVSAESPRRSQQGGIYAAYEFGPAERRVQILMLDLRWNRTALNSVSEKTYEDEMVPKKMGPYLPVTDRDATLMGEVQWNWLEAELQKPARLRIIASSIQLLADFTGWESWANFPAEKQRLFRLLEKYSIGNVLLISGDTHWAEISRIERSNAQPLWEVTSSGLTETWKDVSPNRFRVGGSFAAANYGYIKVDWQMPVPQLEMGIRDVNGKTIMSQQYIIE